MAEKKKLGKLCKERMTEEVMANFKDRPNFIITSYMGSSVADLEQLRKSLKKTSSDYLVVKNSILKLTFGKMKLEEECAKIEGGIGISFIGDDVVACCGIIALFAKSHDKFKVKGAVIDGKRMSVENINRLASLPPRNVLLAQAIGGIKSPISGFVSVLGGIVRKFVCVVDAIKNSKEASKA